MKRSMLVSGMILGLLTACQPIIHSRGNVTVEDNLSKFIVGKTTMSDVIGMCGTPSLHKDNFTWIYIGAKSEEIAFHEVAMTKRCIVKMTFDSNKVLRAIDRIPLSDDSAILTDEEITNLITEKQVEEQLKTAFRKVN